MGKDFLLLLACVCAACLFSQQWRGCWAEVQSVTVQPCVRTELSASFNVSYLLTVSDDLSHCGDGEVPEAFLIQTEAREDSVNSTDPIVFVARNESTVIYWTIPFSPIESTEEFYSVNRTMVFCQSSLSSNFYYSKSYMLFDVYTNSRLPVNFNITVLPVSNFSLMNETESMKTVVSPASPQVFHFSFVGETKQVTLETSSPDMCSCAIVSIQNVTECPPSERFSNTRSLGIHQTMSMNGYITVNIHDVNFPEFYIVLVGASKESCHSPTFFKEEGKNCIFNSSKDIELSITSYNQNPVLSIFVPILVFLGLYAVAFLLYLLLLSRCIWTPICKWRWLPEKYTEDTDNVDAVEGEPKDSLPLIQSHTHHRHYGSPSSPSSPSYPLTPSPPVTSPSPPPPPLPSSPNKCPPMMSPEAAGVRGGAGTPSTVSTSPGSSVGNVETSLRGKEEDCSGDDVRKVSVQMSVVVKAEKDLNLSSTCKKDFVKLQEHYAIYGWNTITVCIFYGLPAFQLVLSQQLVLRYSGNQDVCYYNFQCARPVGVISAFNNVWSNIGYVMLGILFIIFVLIRDLKTQYYLKRNPEKRKYILNHGLPVFYGMFYAMGIALVFEGFMSSFYHICPSSANFQFDTAFMFIIGGLLVIKVFQNRHPDFHTHSFAAFFSFAVVILFTLVGIYLDDQNPLAVRLIVFFMTVVVMGIFLFSFYYFHQWDYVWRGLKYIFNNFKEVFTKRKNYTPGRKMRLAKVILAFMINVLVVVAGLVLGDKFHLATIVLVLFLVNAVYFIAAYIFSKLINREPWTMLPIVSLLLTGLCWGAAFWFYFNAPTDWSMSPAESRSKNSPCQILQFYDVHDIWHFLSAVAMFCAFMFVLTVDDGINHIPWKKIQVF